MSSLTLNDTLAKQDVTIVITLLADQDKREERTALVTVGIPNEPPVMKNGRFADLDMLIEQAWQSFNIYPKDDASIIAETVVIPPHKAKEKPPKPQNLTLF